MAKFPDPIDCAGQDKGARESTVAWMLRALLQADARLADEPRKVEDELRKRCPGAEDQVSNLARVAGTGLLPRLLSSRREPEQEAAIARDVESRTDLSQGAVKWAIGAWSEALGAVSSSGPGPGSGGAAPRARRGRGAWLGAAGALIVAYVLMSIVLKYAEPSAACNKPCPAGDIDKCIQFSTSDACAYNTPLVCLAICILIGGIIAAIALWRRAPRPAA